MVLSDAKIMEYTKRLLMSRMRILVKYGFYGLLLMHMAFTLDETTETAATDGQKIYFNPQFLDSISDDELDYILMHEILHVALNHTMKDEDPQISMNSDMKDEDRDDDEYDETCDNEVNSIILQSVGNDDRKIRVKGYEGDYDRWDDHSKWNSKNLNEFERDVWEKNILDAAEAMESRGENGGWGTVPAFAKRLIGELKKPQVDWKTILNNFIQEEIADYSFTPPDRRFDDGDFFLPDFNEKEDRVKDILFMIDTSGSMSIDMITSAYSEIKGAIDQFNGKLEGWLGFFDAAVIEPKPFADEDEFKLIRAKGGGGTSFDVIFDYVKNQMQNQLPASIIILTDGFAPFPEEEVSMGIPVLWLLNNTEVEPPWGKVTRF